MGGFLFPYHFDPFCSISYLPLGGGRSPGAERAYRDIDIMVGGGYAGWQGGALVSAYVLGLFGKAANE